MHSYCGNKSLPSHAMNGYAGLPLQRNKRQGITESKECAKNSKKANAGLVAGRDVFIEKNKKHHH